MKSVINAEWPATVGKLTNRPWLLSGSTAREPIPAVIHIQIQSKPQADTSLLHQPHKNQSGNIMYTCTSALKLSNVISLKQHTMKGSYFRVQANLMPSMTVLVQ